MAGIPTSLPDAQSPDATPYMRPKNPWGRIPDAQPPRQVGPKEASDKQWWADVKNPAPGSFHEALNQSAGALLNYLARQSEQNGWKMPPHDKGFDRFLDQSGYFDNNNQTIEQRMQKVMRDWKDKFGN